MNGCAAFILVTSLFVMQNGGIALTVPTILLWMVIAARARRIDRLRMEQARETLRKRQYRNGRP